MGFGLYIHIPFCVRKCAYCDFVSGPQTKNTQAKYLEALRKEIGARAEEMRGKQAASLYFGGGTPSLLESKEIITLINKCLEHFQFIPEPAIEPEITLEANPETLTFENLQAFKEAGINRLSLGVQSNSPELLTVLGRNHTSQQVEEAHGFAKAAGFHNISWDLIFGIPEQTLNEWESTLLWTMDFLPDHISLYPLTLEEEEPGEQTQRKLLREKLQGQSEDLTADMYKSASTILKKAGYSHYEISNWSLPGKECRHNLVYWRRQDYLGFGAGAHSHVGGNRYANFRSVEAYVNAINNGGSAGEFHEFLTKEQIDYEQAMLGLRLLNEGLDKPGQSLDALKIKKWEKEGFLYEHQGKYYVNEDKAFLLNTVLCDLLPD